MFRITFVGLVVALFKVSNCQTPWQLSQQFSKLECVPSEWPILLSIRTSFINKIRARFSETGFEDKVQPCYNFQTKAIAAPEDCELPLYAHCCLHDCACIMRGGKAACFWRLIFMKLKFETFQLDIRRRRYLLDSRPNRRRRKKML